MKRTISIAFAAFALLSFTSCQKENLVSGNQEPSQRIVTAVFENDGTKTTLGTNDIPLWAEGDKICILASNDSVVIELQESNITEEGRKVTFTLTKELSGTLYAVYPASATTMTSCDGSINFTIPELQDGTFSSANICVAKGDDKENLVFRNATAVLEITTADDVVGVDITAANNIAGPVTASFAGTTLNLTTSSLDKTSVSAVCKSAPSDNVFYLAAAPGSTGSTTATCYKIDKEGSTNKGDKELKRNVIYSMNLSSITIATDSDLTGKKGILNGHEYVIIKAKYDGTKDSYLKWATMNVGATTVDTDYKTCYGDLYEWGSVETIYNDRPWTSATGGIFTDKWKTGKGSGYSWTTYCGSSSFQEWTPAPYDATTKILTSEYDAATKNWGTGWRMPTSEEFQALYKACGKSGTQTTPEGGYTTTTAKGIYWCTNYNGVAGLLFITKDDGPHLFFPAAGYGNGANLNNAGSDGLYWSSSRSTSSSSNAYSLYFKSDDVQPKYSGSRYTGRSVRPVSD